MAFSTEEIDRYERQVLLPGWGAAGQERVRAARVTVAGVGLAAETAARYLAGAGVGALFVDSAAIAAAATAINPLVRVVPTADEVAGAGVADERACASDVAAAAAVASCAEVRVDGACVGRAEADGVLDGALVALAALRVIVGAAARPGEGVDGAP